jgi:hypothetical protein
LRASVPNLDEAKFSELAGTAEKTCPVSKVLNAHTDRLKYLYVLAIKSEFNSETWNLMA